MTISAATPDVDQIPQIIDVLASWQRDGLPLQLHPGDIGWHLRLGAAQTAPSLRTWSQDGRIYAVGLMESSSLLRVAIAPDTQQHPRLTHTLVQDLESRGSSALLTGVASVEIPTGVLAGDLLERAGWVPGEAFAPMHRDLTAPVENSGLHIEVVGPELAESRVQLQRDSFGEFSTFTIQQWLTMAAGSAYRLARCLMAFDRHSTPVAATTVWSAGAGRPGLIEPLGVGVAHRGHGYGTAITRAAASVLRELGCSSAQVCTYGENVAGIAAYRSAGFAALPLRRDWRRAG